MTERTDPAVQQIEEQTSDAADWAGEGESDADHSGGQSNGDMDTDAFPSMTEEGSEDVNEGSQTNLDEHTEELVAADAVDDDENAGHEGPSTATEGPAPPASGKESGDDGHKWKPLTYWEKVLKGEKKGKWYYYPSLSEHWNERQKYNAARHVILGPVTPDDLQRDDVNDIVSSARNFSTKFHKSEEEGFKGTLELQYDSPEEAQQAYDALVALQLRDDILIRSLYPKENKFVETTDIRAFGDPCNQFTEKIGERTLALIDISDDLTEAMIRNRFPNAVHVFIAYSFVREARKGHAYVEFKTPQEMKEVVGAPVTIGGKEIRTAHLDIIPAPAIISGRIDSELGRIRNKMVTGGVMTGDDRHTLMILKRNCMHYLEVDYVDDKLKSEISKRILPLRTTLGLQERRYSRDKQYSKQGTPKRQTTLVHTEPAKKRGRFSAGDGQFHPGNAQFPGCGGPFNAGGGPFNAQGGPFNAGTGQFNSSDRIMGRSAMGGAPGLMGNVPMGNACSMGNARMGNVSVANTPMGNAAMGNMDQADVTANILMGISNMIRNQSNLGGNMGNLGGMNMGNTPPNMGGLNRNNLNNRAANFSNTPQNHANFGNSMGNRLNQGFNQHQNSGNLLGRNFNNNRGGRW